MQNEKISIRIALVLVVCMIPLTSCTVKASRYNENPDISGKIVGSDTGYIERIIPEKLEDILSQATVVIIGEVVKDDTPYAFNLHGEKSC